MNNHFKLMVSGAAISCLILPTPLLAQTADTDENITDDYVVSVTARKREESLTEVPISISVLSDSMLEETGILTQDDLFSLVPGIQYDQPVDRNTALPSIRGVQSSDLSTNRARVAQFIDGMPVLGSQGNIQFGSVQQVEVYRGPQSAAFGRSTFAGAINYVTQDPGDQFEAVADIDFDNYGKRKIGASFGGPVPLGTLSDTLGYRIDLEFEDSTSPDEFETTGGEQWGERSSESYGGKLVWEPTDALTAELSVTHVESDDSVSVEYFIDTEAFNACWDNTEQFGMGGGPYSTGQANCDWSQGPQIVSQSNRVPNLSAAIENQTDGLYDGIVLGDTTAEQLLFIADAQSMEADGVGSFDERDRVALQLDYAFDNGSLFQFSSFAGAEELSNWRDTEFDDRTITIDIEDNGFYTHNTMGNIGTVMANPTEIDEFYLEARYVSPDENRLRYVLGASYYDYNFDTTIYFGGYQSILDGTTDDYDRLIGALLTVEGDDGITYLAQSDGVTRAQINGVDAVYNLENALLGAGVIDTINSVTRPNQIFSETAENFGAYGNLVFDVSERLTATFEGRIQRDTVGGTNSLTGGSAELVTESFLPRLSANYNFDNGTSVYAQYARGNNPAGVNSGYLGGELANTLDCAAFDYRTDDSGFAITENGDQLLDINGDPVSVTDGVRNDIVFGLDGTTDVFGNTEALNGMGQPNGMAVAADDIISSSSFLELAPGSDVVCCQNYVTYDSDDITFFKEETIDNFEIGIKGRILDGAFDFTAAAFYMDWKNQGRNVSLDWTDPVVNLMGTEFGGERTYINEGDIEMKGVEFEGTAQLTDDFSIRGQFSYLDATYADFCDLDLISDLVEEEDPIIVSAADSGLGYACVDVSGNKVVQQAPWTGSISPSYRTQLNNGLRFTARGDVRYESAEFLDTANIWETAPVTTTNLSAALSGDRWGVTLYVNNIFNENQPLRYDVGDDYSDDPTLDTFTQKFLITPRQQRTIGLRANVSY